MSGDGRCGHGVPTWPPGDRYSGDAVPGAAGRDGERDAGGALERPPRCHPAEVPGGGGGAAPGQLPAAGAWKERAMGEGQGWETQVTVPVPPGSALRAKVPGQPRSAGEGRGRSIRSAAGPGCRPGGRSPPRGCQIARP